MKKYIYLLLIFLLNFSYASLTDTSFSTKINECKTDIYFGNGVWNTEREAEAGRKVLDEFIIKKEIIRNNPQLQTKYGEVKLQYNWGKGYMDDVLETYYQLSRAGQVNGMGFYRTMLYLTRGSIPLSSAATAALMARMPYIAEVEQANVDQMFTDYYLESLQWSHRVLLISHSQGNMFANRVYESLDPVGYQKYFANVQVASPAMKISAEMGRHTTLRGDMIINPIPFSMSGNVRLAPKLSLGVYTLPRHTITSRSQ